MNGSTVSLACLEIWLGLRAAHDCTLAATISMIRMQSAAVNCDMWTSTSRRHFPPAERTSLASRNLPYDSRTGTSTKMSSAIVWPSSSDLVQQQSDSREIFSMSSKSSTCVRGDNVPPDDSCVVGLQHKTSEPRRSSNYKSRLQDPTRPPVPSHSFQNCLIRSTRHRREVAIQPIGS